MNKKKRIVSSILVTAAISVTFIGITLLGLAICVGGIIPLKELSNNYNLYQSVTHIAGLGKRTFSDLYAFIAATMATSGLMSIISSRKGYLTAKAMKEEKEKNKAKEEVDNFEDSSKKSNNINATMEAMNTQDIEFMRVANVPRIDFDQIRRDSNEPERPYFDNPLVEIPKVISEGKVR